MLKTHINNEAVEKVRSLIQNKRNGFVLCATGKDFEALEKVIPNLSASIPFRSKLVLRIGKGELKDIITSEEAEGLDFDAIKNISYGYLLDRHSWRLCGLFDKHYDWTAKDWQSNNATGLINPFIECFCCSKLFADDEILYQGYVKMRDGIQLKSLCKSCAYDNSDKVTDYVLDDNGDPKIVEWRRDKIKGDMENV